MMGSAIFWLGLFTLIYMALTLFWARQAALVNHNVETWFSAGHSVAPWMGALVGAGASVSVWFLLGTADAVAARGFSAIAALQAGVLLAIPGILFYKRAWFIARRFRVSSQIELFRLYYRSEFLAISCAVIALLFAVGFAGMQLRLLSSLLSTMTTGELSPFLCAALLTLILFSYVAIGGLRAVAYVGMLQAVALVSATLTLGGVILTSTGDPLSMMAGLATSMESQNSQWFRVAGVIQFVPGFGRGEFLAHSGSAAMIFSASIAVL